MNISAPFIFRPVMTTFVMLAIILAGMMTYLHLPVNDLPTIEYPSITVTTDYKGANPETVLNQITTPIEKELAQVKGIQEITSTSRDGSSSITMQFDLTKNMDEAIRDIQSALNRVENLLPSNLDQRPTYYREESNQEPIMYLFLHSDHASVGELRRIADTQITPRLSRIEGVSKIDVCGAEKTIKIQINPDLMAARQIGFNEVIDAVRHHTAHVPLGSIQTGSKTLSIELSGSIHDAKQLYALPIGTRNLRLKDIATVSEEQDDEPEFHFVTKQKSSTALALLIKKASDANTVEVSKRVHEVAAAIQKELPSSSQLQIWFDKAVWIKESIVDVEWSLLIAFMLVIVVIYLSLGRFTDALIPSASLPLSLIGTLAVIYCCGFSLNLLSLLALTLSVGFVVDDAIVVLENIIRRQENDNLSPLQASLQGSKQICFTVLSMTISLVAVFIPLLFMEGMNGRLFREFSITLAIAILVSGFISLTLIPMLSSRFLTKNRAISDVPKKKSTILILYGKTLQWCFNYPKTILLLALACIGIAVPLFTTLPIALIPPEDRGFLFTSVALPSGLSNTEATKWQNRLEPIFQQNKYIDTFLSINFDKSILFLTHLLPREERPSQNVVIDDLQKTLDTIPGVQAFTQGYQMINIDMDFGSQGKYELNLKGSSFAEVDNAASLLTSALQNNPAISFVKSSAENDAPKLVVNVNEKQATKLGLHKQHVQELLKQAYGYSAISEIERGATKEKILLQLQPEYRNRPGSLANLPLITSDGTLIPLKAVAEWEERLGSSALKTQDLLPRASLHFSFAERIAPNVGLQLIEKTAANVLPSGVSYRFGKSAAAVSSTMKNTLILLLAAACVMYIVLGMLYESFIHPLTILSSLPFAALGGTLTLFLCNEPISIFSAVGFLLLIGIVKKNGIMMIDFALEAQREGKTPQEAIFEGCLARFRPIMMTTVAAIMGAIPIAIGIGEGAEMQRGLGLVIAGGLLFSQVLTLYVTPILYLTFDRLAPRTQVSLA